MALRRRTVEPPAAPRRLRPIPAGERRPYVLCLPRLRVGPRVPFRRENARRHGVPPPRFAALPVAVHTALLYQVVFVDYMVITASGGGYFGVTTLAPTSNGLCTFVDTVVGVEKENMQDRNSVRVSWGILARGRQIPVWVSSFVHRGSEAPPERLATRWPP